MVGGDYLPRNIQCLAEDGRHVSIATTGGPKAEVFIPAIMRRRLTLTGSTLRPRSVAFQRLVAAEQMRVVWARSEEHTSELQSLMRNSYAVFRLKTKNINNRKK